MEILQKIRVLEKESEDFGFHWPNAERIIDKIKSELAEVQEALEQKECDNRLQEEVGDLIQAVLSLCHFLKFDAEKTLAITAQKYEQRLKSLIALSNKKGFSTLSGQSEEAKLKLWQEIKNQG